MIKRESSVPESTSVVPEPPGRPDLPVAELLEQARRYSFRGRIDADEHAGPIFTHARGSTIWDIEGNEYLDFNSGQMCAAIGHNDERVVRAIEQAAHTMIHAHSSYLNVPEITLARRLAELLPDPLEKSLFGESGADANEMAVLVARVATGGTDVFSPHVGYHGVSQATRSVTFAGWRRNHGPLDRGAHPMVAPYCYRCPLQKSFPSCGFACLDVSFELIEAQAAEQPAAVITEPVFSAGGVIDPPPGWLARLREMTTERDMMLIVDEEQTGLGKLGTMFGFETESVVPDIVTIAKHFGGGVGISSLTTSAETEERASDAGITITRSHSNDPLPCAAGIASLDVVVEDDMPARARELGARMLAGLHRLAAEHEIIGDVRGRGMLVGIELVRDRETKEPFPEGGHVVARHCFAHGLIFSTRRGGSVLRFVPPATTSAAQVDRALELIDEGLRRALPKLAEPAELPIRVP